ncbi:histidinol-phosphatase [Devosia algicola]|uniref:Histidinol-phosphatase n=1 Tax=Devosia algicola TaxID=3026418 RepID=A0ABY7YIX8_9HYPH|nr:histidinol-phosphatase [Devosia algicola]WDR01221.1 histidinol-phosphatase [Devosia algicola]
MTSPSSLAGLDPIRVRQTLLDAAEAAATHTMPRFRTALAVDNKWSQGFDPVTEADRQAEIAVRDLIASRFPDHGIIGEEWDEKATKGRFQWIVDPIDGTRAYISGVPVWGTLIGLMIDGRAAAGLMAQPFTGETFLAMPGNAEFRRHDQTRPLHTSNITQLSQAKLTATTPDLFAKTDTENAWNALRSKVLQTRYGLDCYGYCLLAAGHIDLVVEAGLKDVDICPLIPLIENTGGIVTTWDGGHAEKGGNCVAAATRELHDAALKVLRDAQT